MIRRPHRIEGRREQRSPLIRMRGGAISADKGEGLLSLQTASPYRLAHGLLRPLVERTKRMRQRDPHLALVHATDHPFAQPRGQHQAGRYPRRLSPQNPGDTLGTKLFLLADGVHHPRFIHRRERAERTIGLQKRNLLRKARHRFLYHRHSRKPGCAPPLEPFESVDDLVVSLFCLHDAKRQITQAYRSLRPRCFVPRAQTFEARAYPR